MGEQQHETDQQRSPNAGKRPSPTSVKELLDIVHLQQASPLNIAVKQDADVLSSSSRGGFNPLPAIGKSAGAHPPGQSGQALPAGPPKTAVVGEEAVRRTRANSDGCQYNGSQHALSRHSALSSSLENGTAMPTGHSPRDAAHHHLHGPPQQAGGRPAQQRRERMLPPISQLSPTFERPQSRQAAAAKTPLRRTSSGGESMRDAAASHPSEERTRQRPKSSHGRRRPLASEIIALHKSVPPPYELDEEVSAPADTSPRPPQGSSSRDTSRVLRTDRPKSSKGRTRQGVTTTGTLSQGDDWSSEDDMRPRAPSPPSPGLDSDLDSGIEGNDDTGGRNARPR